MQKEWRFNCYGFINQVLLEHHPKAHNSLVEFMLSNRTVPVSFDKIPCPFHYSAFFDSLSYCKNPHWARVAEMSDLQPGDFIIYLPQNYVPKNIEAIGAKRTGMHIMIVEEVVSTELNQVSLSIVDCTRFRHCWEDAREKGGIGRSPLTIERKEKTYALRWGSREKTLEKELFFGRLIS
ncbi:MAG: hypothetical protein JSS32_06370 [Verrucomicrobia bacterium]|nr:hypothetical protein [Verrucomicrobiota bacterium]